MLEARLLGQYDIRLDGKAVIIPSRPNQSIFAYLLLHPDSAHRREKLAGLFWPEASEINARSNLRHALWRIRQALGSGAQVRLHGDDLGVSWHPQPGDQLDVTAFDACVEAGSMDMLIQAMAVYKGELLPGFYEEWVVLERERLNQRAFSTLRHLAGYWESHGDYQQAAACASRQLEIEPWDEAAIRQAMRSLTFSKQRNAALAQYESFQQTLMQELGVAPTRETTALYESIRAGSFEQVHIPAFLHESQEQEVWPVFVARQAELGRMDGWLRRARLGQGQVVFVTGDPGSGKTALIQEFVRRAMQSHADLIVASGKCNLYGGIGDPYLPFIQILQMLTGDVEAQWVSGAISREHACRLWALLPEAVRALIEIAPGLLDRLVAAPALVARAQACAPGEAWQERLDECIQRQAAAPLQQTALFEQVTHFLKALARLHPLVIILDDLQWADVGSLSLLFHLGRQLVGSRILVTGAYRVEDLAAGRDGQRHPLEPVVHEFQGLWGDISLDLDQAEGRTFVEALLDREPNHLTATFRQTLYEHTAGHPLFTVELLRDLQDHGGIIQDTAGYWMETPSLNWDQLPSRVEAVIAERLRRLPEDWQKVMAVASIEGEQFSAEVVARARGSDVQELIQLLSGPLSQQYRLVRATSCEQLDGRRLSFYRFQHHLFQRYLYTAQDMIRRASLHQVVGEALEQLYGDRAEEIAASLAWHFESAGLPEKAVSWLQRSGERAKRLSADAEAIGHLSHAIELLHQLPVSAGRDLRELELLLALAAPLQAQYGYAAPEVGRVYESARQLCQSMDDTPQLFMMRWGLQTYYGIRAEYRTAGELYEQNMALARRLGDPVSVALMQWQQGWLFTVVGEFNRARACLEPVIAVYDPQLHGPLAFTYGQDMGVSCHAWLSWDLLFLGYPDQALQHSRAAIKLAEKLEAPFSLVFALGIAGSVLHHFLQDDRASEEFTTTALQLSEKEGFAFYQMMNLSGQAIHKIFAGRVDEGLAQARQCLTQARLIGAEMNRSFTLGWLAEACGKAGQVETGMDFLLEGLDFVQNSDERFFEAELYRIRGDLLLAQDESQAQACYHQAIAIARRQQARWWELRAALSLSRLLQRQGKRAEARQTLGGIHSWFTEGFDTSTLQETRLMLDELDG